MLGGSEVFRLVGFFYEFSLYKGPGFVDHCMLELWYSFGLGPFLYAWSSSTYLMWSESGASPCSCWFVGPSCSITRAPNIGHMLMKMVALNVMCGMVQCRYISWTPNMRVGTSQTLTSCAVHNLWTISHVVYVSIPFWVVSWVKFCKAFKQCRLHTTNCLVCMQLGIRARALPTGSHNLFHSMFTGF